MTAEGAMPMDSRGSAQRGGSRWRTVLLVAIALACVAAGAAWAFLNSSARFAEDDSMELSSVTKHRNSPFAGGP